MDCKAVDDRSSSEPRVYVNRLINHCRKKFQMAEMNEDNLSPNRSRGNNFRSFHENEIFLDPSLLIPIHEDLRDFYSIG